MQFSKMNGNIQNFLKIPKVLDVVKRDLKAQLVVACSRMISSKIFMTSFDLSRVGVMLSMTEARMSQDISLFKAESMKHTIFTLKFSDE